MLRSCKKRGVAGTVRWRAGVFERLNNARGDQYPTISVLSRRDPGTGHYSKRNWGFTLLEVMIALAIIAIALVTVLASQSQSLSLAGEAKFNTTAALLAQSKLAEIEAENPENLASDSGDFGENFPGYHWDLTVSSPGFAGVEEVLDYLKQVDLVVSWGEQDRYQYRLRLYRFVSKRKEQRRAEASKAQS
jgi:general secretion pathway protein I